MTCLFLFIYLPNREEIYKSPKSKAEPVSIVMPCYNDGEHIGEAIESLLSLDYPKDMIEIIVVDDCSKDNSVETVREYTKRYSNVRLIINKRNSGGAAEPTNIGIKAAKYNYIAVADADSMPKKDALIKMIGYLQEDKKVGAVTCAVLAKRANNFMQHLQSIEYKVIAFTRKLLDFVDSVYVTPGPFALYRKKTLLEVGMFDTKNMTQDIEIVWRLMSKGYIARMCFSTEVYSETPTKFRAWARQRIRWNIGGTQTLIKYRSLIFRRGMLGAFVIPFFSASLFLGIFGLGIFFYLMIKRFLISYFTLNYSLSANASVLTLNDLSFSPSVLNFFGAVLFFLGIFVTVFALSVTGKRETSKHNIFSILFYMVIYLSIYPFIMIVGLTKLITGRYSW